MMSQDNQTSAISIKNLGLSFGKTEVLKGVNLDIKAGEFFSFLGPSGSGKSTLLRAISGFGPTPTGSIKIGGEEVIGLPAWQRNVGMVFQSYALWPHMSVRKNVAFGLEERKVPKTEIAGRVDEALDLVALKHLADRSPGQLSGGQQQRIALARTVVVKPRVLLLDEPLSNLDANLRVQMRRDILALQRSLDLTTIFVTHDQEEANTISDRMAVLDAGIIQQIGTPVALYDQPVNRFVASFLGTANIIKGKVSNGNFEAEHGFTLAVDSKDNAEKNLILRPQSLTLYPSPVENTKAYQLKGIIEYSEFLGDSVRYAVMVSGHSVLVDTSHHRGSDILQKGSAVWVSIPKDQILLLD
ncbi:MAG: ABC transporter ATP-binding protein [Cocleimonas sp.]|nr:ABC transporter ATP-binding protein [Cocleimonas sp.]